MNDWETPPPSRYYPPVNKAGDPPPSDYMEDDLQGAVYGTSRLEEIDEEDDR